MPELILSAITLGMLMLTVPLLALKMPQHGYQLPLLQVLLALAVIISGPLIFAVVPELIFTYIALLPIAFLALPPGLYLYTLALTARTPWRWQWQYLALYWPQLLAIPLALLIYSLPVSEQQAMFFSDSATLQGQSLICAVIFLLATVLWLVLSLFYLIRICMQLKHYRQQLRQVFAADADKQLGWVGGLMAALLINWSHAVLVFLVGERIASPWLSETGVMLLALIMVWLLCYCGLKQQPGFAELFARPDAANQPESVVEVSAATEAEKYQRSALGEEQALRISGKVQHAVYQETLYLDPALTLYKLAEHIGVSAQYLSQTLNQTLQRSFYDYINEARISAAKQQLLHTDDSILTIAMAVGFNARSSFYKAFKASTGLTPVQYRSRYVQ